ncbi:hypothetical protein [Labrenzia sp. R5_0]|uniref:hypothetical protein n=1 Tax=Labrenzia sp. R5_0 TaxID=2821108 RepID=UPI001AD9A9AB|nr:hypothetical protein [Labrenzia sp. R5_0]MBO9459013.1 hypothetical protein [Labrenzia sp. R5_0]
MQKSTREEAAYRAGRMDAQILSNLYFAGMNARAPDLSGLSDAAKADLIGGIITNICELPDRTSPDDQPDMMLVTAEELDLILRRHVFGDE